MSDKKKNLPKTLKEALDGIRDPEFELESKAHLLQARFLIQIEKAMEGQGINKKELAKKIGISKEYLCQAFTADKFIDFKTLARIEQVLNIEFNDISSSPKSSQQTL